MGRGFVLITKPFMQRHASISATHAKRVEKRHAGQSAASIMARFYAHCLDYYWRSESYISTNRKCYLQYIAVA